MASEQRIFKIYRTVNACFLIFFIFTGCGYVPERYHPLFKTYVADIQKVLLLPPEVGAFKELPDGSLLRQEGDSRSAVQQAKAALGRALVAKHFDMVEASSELSAKPETLRIQALFRAVNHSIQLHTFGPQLFPDKLQSFEYEMGPVDDLLAAVDADALMLVTGQQTVSTSEPRSWISIAIVEPQGHIIWYGMQGAKAVLDLQTAMGSQKLVNEVLAKFPGGPS